MLRDVLTPVLTLKLKLAKYYFIIPPITDAANLIYNIFYILDERIHIETLGQLIHNRRIDVGLTQQRLAQLASLSRQTVQRLEAGTINDLSFQRLSRLLGVLGLSFDAPSLTARQKKNGLAMAANTSSVSYRNVMTSDQLEKALASGDPLRGYEANLLHFLDEAPVHVVVMAIEETALRESVNPSQIWSNGAKLADQLGARRSELWT